MHLSILTGANNPSDAIDASPLLFTPLPLSLTSISYSSLRSHLQQSMEDGATEYDKKPFDAELGGHEEETQPDPDESLLMESGNGRVWLVKVLNFASTGGSFL